MRWDGAPEWPLLMRLAPYLLHPALRGTSRPRPAALGAVLLALVMVAVGERGAFGGSASVIWWADGGWTLFALAALGGCLVAARRGGAGRRSWLLFAGACATWLGGQMAWNYYELVDQVRPPFPSWGDAGWLGFVPWFAAGLCVLPRRRHRYSTTAIFALDLAIMALGLTLIGILASQGLLAGSINVTTAGTVVALAYPAAYLTLGLGTFVLMAREPGLAGARGMGLLLLGLLCEGVGFVVWVPLLLHHTFHDGTTLDLVWMIGLAAICLAGLEWRAPASPPVTDRQTADDAEDPLTRIILGLVPTVLGTAIALVAPMLGAGSLRGLLDLFSRVLIASIACRQLAMVWENRRLYQGQAAQRSLAHRRAERLRRVQELGRAVRLDLDPAHIGQLVVETVDATLGYRLTILNLITNPAAPQAKQRIQPVAAVGLDPAIAPGFLAQDAPLSDVVGLLREEFCLSRSFFLPAERAAALFPVTEIPRWTPPQRPTSIDGWQPGDEFIVPLIAPRTNSFLGFLSLDAPSNGRRPAAEDAEILELFADQAALALDNARLYADARERTQRSEAVGVLLHALGQHVEVEALLEIGMGGLVDLTSADSASLYDYDASGKVLIWRAGAGLDLSTGADAQLLPLSGSDTLARVLASRAPVVISAPQTPDEAATMARLGCRSVLGVPLLAGGVARGVAFINYVDEERTLTVEEYRFVQEVVDALAVALERAALYDRARVQALRDPVTDLANHRALQQHLDTALRRYQTGEQEDPVALLLIDVDNFKLFNDTYGHLTGDAVLRQIAEHLRTSVRESDVAARYGGDEFAALLPGADAAVGAAVAARVACAVAATPYIADDGARIPLSVSVGVAAAPADGATRLALLAVADARMYAAKHGPSADPTLLRSAADLLGETRFGVLEGLVAAVDAKDHYTREHSLDVTRYALLLAEALNLDEDTRRTLALAGPLHDIGKIAVPDRILRKPGPLTADEYEAIKAHVAYGVAIVRGLLDDPQVLSAIAHHHERFNGQGYPAGATGAETPLVGRILQIADAVSAMTLDRPYRRGLAPEQVIDQLRRGAGSQFDPELVEPFIGAFQSIQGHPPAATLPWEPLTFSLPLRTQAS